MKKINIKIIHKKMKDEIFDLSPFKLCPQHRFTCKWAQALRPYG